MSDEPVRAPAPGATPAPRTCAWCGTPAPAGATHCPSCGAALQQVESLGDVVVPGVTGVDPGLEIEASMPLDLPPPAPAFSPFPNRFAAHEILRQLDPADAGLAELVGFGGLAGLGAAAGQALSGPERTYDGALDDVGEPSDLARRAADAVERGDAPPTERDIEATTWADEPGHGDDPGHPDPSDRPAGTAGDGEAHAPAGPDLGAWGRRMRPDR